MKSNDQRGLTGQRLQELRLREGFGNQKDAARYVTAKTGVGGLSGGVWGEYESGRKENGKLLRPISAKHRAAIESVWGPIGDQTPAPATVAPAGSGDISALVDAIDRQTKAINALVERLGDPSETAAVVARTVLGLLQATGVLEGLPEQSDARALPAGQ